MNFKKKVVLSSKEKGQVEATMMVVVGRPTRDPELKTTNTGKKIASVNVAINSYDAKTKETKVSFVRIDAWEDKAEKLMKIAQKGRQSVIVGVEKTETYKDKDGNEKQGSVLVLDTIYGLGPKKSDAGEEPIAKAEKDADDEDITFDI